jgi:hypothetical protein
LYVPAAANVIWLPLAIVTPFASAVVLSPTMYAVVVFAAVWSVVS